MMHSTLIDTHCHIHESYPFTVTETIERAKEAGVEKMVCVGTNIRSSELALRAADVYDELYAAIGVHPHDTKDGYEAIAELAATASGKLVAIGEIGLDYYYGHSPREVQLEALRAQLEVAKRHNLPVSFHVRDAFDDFWPVFDSFKGLRGVLHSFTDTQQNLDAALERGLYIGVNGISTFTKDAAQQAMYDTIPEGRILFETDAPFLTPPPFRGKVNEPAYVRLVAQYHAERRGVSIEQLMRASTHNAYELFQFLPE